MAAIRTTTNILFYRVPLSAFSSKRVSLPLFKTSISTTSPQISTTAFRCFAASQYGDAGRKASARLSQVQQLLVEAEERASSAVNEPPPPKIGLGYLESKNCSSLTCCSSLEKIKALTDVAESYDAAIQVVRCLDKP